MNQSTAVSLTAISIAAATCYLGWSLYKKTRRREIPTVWKQVGVLTDIFLYPIKSCRYLRVEEADCTELGLRKGILRDRTLMVIDEAKNFITARTYPELLKISTREEGGSELVFSHESMEELRVNLDEVVKGKEENATVWSNTVKVFDCGEEAAAWVSRIVMMSPAGLRLAYYGRNHSMRIVREKHRFLKYYSPSDAGAFQDEMAFNLINLESVEDLNSKLQPGTVPIKPTQFRSNFFVKGPKPLDEDSWQFVKIGDNVFEVIKACQRCILTTVDPETGMRSSVGEPLKTLNKYRKYEAEMLKRLGSSPRMGVQMALRSQPAKIKISDPVFVSYQ